MAKQFLQCQERLLQESRQSPWRRYGVTDSTRTLGLLGNKESDLCLVDFRPVEDTSQKAEQFDRLQLPGLNYVIRKLSLNIVDFFVFGLFARRAGCGEKVPIPSLSFVCACVSVRACVCSYTFVNKIISLSLSFSLSLSLSVCLSLSLSLSHTHTHTHTVSLSHFPHDPFSTHSVKNVSHSTFYYDDVN